MDTGKPIYHRNCPKCNIELTYKWKQSFIKAEHTDQTCYKCRPIHWQGKTHTEETKKKMSVSSPRIKTNLGKSFSPEHKKRIAKANMGNKARTGMPHSEETKQKMRESWANRTTPHPNELPENREKFRELHQRRVVSRCGQITPNYNPIACQLFEEINREMGWSGMHAENGGEKNIRGWFLDYYEPNLNIVVEYDEPHHLRTKRKAKDIRKEKEVIELLGCKYYHLLPEQNWRDILS